MILQTWDLFSVLCRRFAVTESLLTPRNVQFSSNSHINHTEAEHEHYNIFLLTSLKLGNSATFYFPHKNLILETVTLFLFDIIQIIHPQQIKT